MSLWNGSSKRQQCDCNSHLSVNSRCAACAAENRSNHWSILRSQRWCRCALCHWEKRWGFLLRTALRSWLCGRLPNAQILCKKWFQLQWHLWTRWNRANSQSLLCVIQITGTAQKETRDSCRKLGECTQKEIKAGARRFKLLNLCGQIKTASVNGLDMAALEKEKECTAKMAKSKNFFLVLLSGEDLHQEFFVIMYHPGRTFVICSAHQVTQKRVPIGKGTAANQQEACLRQQGINNPNPRKHFHADLKQAVQEQDDTNDNKEVLVLGDFNECLCQRNSGLTDMVKELNSYDLLRASGGKASLTSP